MAKTTSGQIRKTYLVLMLFNTLAASLIWGINTLFLLDAGLSNVEAFAANAFFTLGQVIFEIPTGVVADIYGRRLSYLLGAISLSVGTFLYVVAWQMHAAFWIWALISIILGLGFAFFSGATEAWLVDALKATRYKGKLETVFGHGQVVGGVAMLTGSVAGGFIAQFSNLGIPYFVRAGMLLITFAIAFFYMHDLGFKPLPRTKLRSDIKRVWTMSLEYGWKNPSVKWTMLAGAFTLGIGVYVFYAIQPRLLELYGDKTAYVVVGLAAAVTAGAEIVGGFLVPRISKWFKKRTTILWAGSVINVVVLLLIGSTDNFWITLVLIVLWGLTFAATLPIRQAYLNSLIPSGQRATVLSFDSLIGSSGGVVAQPALGKVADMYGYPASYVASGVLTIAAVPLIGLARSTNAKGDVITKGG